MIDNDRFVTLTSDIVTAHVSNNSVTISDFPQLIQNVHAALTGLFQPATDPVVKQESAVSIRSSIKPDYLVCLEDGKKLKMLKRHLMTHYQMTPQEYRAKWSLPADYPMVAPNYSEQRRILAKKIGLGRRSGKRASKQRASTNCATPQDHQIRAAQQSWQELRGRRQRCRSTWELADYLCEGFEFLPLFVEQRAEPISEVERSIRRRLPDQ